MSGFFIAVLAMAVVLGFMILIHEFGHYAVAKLLGVRVEVFSIGFGKRLIGFRRGDTDYRIAAIPLGGYVKMSGENPMDERTNDPGEFLSHPRWHRFLIAIAGPFMNIMLAIGLLTCCLHGALRISRSAGRARGHRLGVARHSRGKSWNSDWRSHRSSGRNRESYLEGGRPHRSSQPESAARCHHRARREIL